MGIAGAPSRASEFDRQVETVIARGYPRLAGVTRSEFAARVEQLRELVPADGGGIPFVLVVRGVAAARAIERVERRGETGFSVLDAEDLDRFRPIDGLVLPGARAYLLLDVDTGRDTLNVTPDDALGAIRDRGRSPLTIDEGIALVTQHPESVAKGAGFSLLGSRCGDRRVTALWISENRPKLGWCWAGNPHTWLGSASCGGRAG